MSWWAWILVFAAIAGIGAWWCWRLTRATWRAAKATAAAGADLAGLLDLGTAHRPPPAAPVATVFTDLSQVLRETDATRAALKEERRQHRESNLPGWVRR